MRPGFLEVTRLQDVGSCQTMGGTWVQTRHQLAVQVPSVVIPEEFNLLLNPTHADYHALVWSEPQPFHFDPRLFLTEPQTL